MSVTSVTRRIMREAQRDGKLVFGKPHVAEVVSQRRAFMGQDCLNPSPSPNHLLEHIDKATDECVELLLAAATRMVFISVPFESELNNISGHQRLYGKDYLVKELGPAVQERVPGVRINAHYADLGIIIFERARN